MSDKERIEKAFDIWLNIRNDSPSEYSTAYQRHLKAFIAGAEYERTIADQQLGLQEIELNHTKTLLASCEKALEFGWNNQVAELKEQVDLQHEMARADQAKIASLKEALRRAYPYLKEDSHGYENLEEIENLLK